MPTSYIPDNDAARASWLHHFSETLPLFAAVLDISPQQLADTKADAAWFSWLVQQHFNAKQYQKALTAMKELYRNDPGQRMPEVLPVLHPAADQPPPVRYGIFNRITMLVAVIKNHLSYTEAIGTALGIIASRQPLDVSAMQLTLYVALNNGQPEISWQRGRSHAISIYVSRSGGPFEHFGKFIMLSCIDRHPLPPEGISEKWSYKARYMLLDEEVGEFSEVASLVVVRV